MAKKIAMIIALRDFRDEECFIPRSVFIQQGIEVKIVSEKKEKAIGVYGGVVDVDLELKELKARDFDAVIFVGGAGAVKYVDNKECVKIIYETIKQNKILAAICIAPIILAKTGVLKNKKATVWSNNIDKSAVKILETQGAIYQDAPVVVDGKIITANGPMSARKFAETIVNAIQG